MASIDPASAAASSTGTTPTPATGQNKATDAQNQFLKLLVAQLQGQNPLDPLDGTQFVTQLAQFSTLQELTGMHTDLDNIQKYMQTAANQAAQQTTKTTQSSPTAIF